MFIVTALLLSWSAPAEILPVLDWSCETELAATPRGGREIFAGYMKLSSGSELFVRIERPFAPRFKGWVMLLHGLLDSHRAWDGVTRHLIAQGYGVVRPDLRGFARSLHDRHPLPKDGGVIDYTENVRDIFELLLLLGRDYGIRRPRMVAHSMSGGLLLPLLGLGGIEREIDSRALIINPYVYRAEFYVAEKLNWSLPSLSALDRWTPDIFKKYPQAVLDTLLDPQLRFVFTGYFEDLVKSRGVRIDDAAARRVIRRQVDIAIATVKGLRKLDALEAIKSIPPELRVDMAYADHDDVVEPPLARKLARAIEKRGGTITVFEGHHRTPEEFPEAVARLITE